MICALKGDAAFSRLQVELEMELQRFEAASGVQQRYVLSAPCCLGSICTSVMVLIMT